ncbi:MAG: HEAT repeat domain-containing protein [Erysipelotrichia bacterium]|nr:HEAT repeat domain-containing protein [Erysipelotrichia bacterium]
MKKIAFFLCIALIALTGCFSGSAEDLLAKDLKSQDVKVRLEAAKKLGDVATPEALRLLMSHKDDPDFRVKEAIQKSLKKIDKRTFLN